MELPLKADGLNIPGWDYTFSTINIQDKTVGTEGFKGVETFVSTARHLMGDARTLLPGPVRNLPLAIVKGMAKPLWSRLLIIADREKPESCNCGKIEVSS
jgi:hypothetical protein